MKYIKLYEGFKEDIDIFDEEDWDETEIDKNSLIYWLNQRYEFNLDKLKTIDCSYYELENLNGIGKCINLTDLNCSNNQLENLNGIENCINLDYLYCYNNNLTELKGIENFINLKILYCKNNQFSNEYKEYLKNYCKEKRIYFDI
jgi:Leucine-rich repeat (LRR) protein